MLTTGSLKMPPMFSRLQDDLIHRAAALVDEDSREAFWRSIATRLESETYPSDRDVKNAITFVLSVRGVSASSTLLGHDRKHQHQNRRQSP